MIATMRIPSITWLLVLALPVMAHAQTTETGSVQTGSGTTMSGAVVEPASVILQRILDIAPTRVAKSAKNLLVSENIQTSWMKESALARQRMNDQRIECNDIIRRSNRDQRMGKMLQCQRAMLLLDVNLLRSQATYIGATPLVDATLKATATGAMARLEDAEMAIVDGIDTGLFVSEDQLLAARNNLRISYREPVWVSLMKVRIDRELTNLLYISKLLKERTDVDSFSPIRETALCLEMTASGLQMAKNAEDRQTGGVERTAVRLQTATCQGLLRAVRKADRQQEKIRAKEAAAGKVSP